MPTNILQRLSQNYFQGIADDISNAKAISAIYPNMNDVGDVRENILKSFLESHIPQKCSVIKGGNVFDSLGNESAQIDLLITNDISLRFSYFDRQYNTNKNIQTVEGCLAAISVKSTLDKTQLINTLENLASIPQMPADILNQINPLVNNRESYLMFPKKIVFAFSPDISGETALNHINEYYSTQSVIENQKVDLIIVNNHFLIAKIGKGGATTRDGTQIQEGSYHLIPNGGAYFLLELLKMIQSTASWSSHLFLDYQKYINAMPF